MKYLIVGLGNVGSEYENTRHNIGFDVVHAFVQKHGGGFKLERLAYVASLKWKGKNLVCICPTTFMNLSGSAVKYWMDKEKIGIEKTLIIVDELALPLSKMRLKSSGSDGGHNGLKSIASILETKSYPRLRFGIGNHYPKGRQADFVLSKWKKDEEKLVKYKIDKAIELIESFISCGIEQTMNEVNNKEYSI
ncbi:MAG: aminoacyl-tRNA hydrolase [Chitinophagaceae bacterium]|nr:MAG: aminoacyl-tRNA hydrolase [Chitinophagaceae bacterium]